MLISKGTNVAGPPPIEAQGEILELEGDFSVLPVFLSVGVSPIVTWLLTEIPVDGQIGFDPFLFSIGKFFPQPLHHSSVPPCYT